ncbi:bifunctional DNA primase/polymerase [Bradyrhizobium sp. URHA0013]|uniref:bifunctional DNA primase/polymerase n=1 Tax=Bradyrhizobium sp. URHA0013 TaxID=1380352 RepID=UPI0004B49E85|nr:bifunctional DNA primase/polymerase [Bradyrhizobium sp. URHA0013]
MGESSFAQTAPSLVALGYSPLPIMPNSKTPGTDSPMKNWQEWCRKAPPPNAIAGWSRYADCGVGVACGMGLICIDIDFEPAMEALIAMLPQSNVQKRGKKGVSLFYRGNTDVIRSRNFRTPDRVGLVDLLSEGKQTVLPPSIHPDTGEPYYWWTDDTLMDVRLSELTELPDDIAERIGEVLKAYGYDPDLEGPSHRLGSFAASTASAGGSVTAPLFRAVNNQALASLAAWVPHLGLQRCYRAGGGFKAVANWRASGTGRALHLRAPNLSFRSDGIRDFGDGRGYSPIDVVVEARRLSPSNALEWLAPRVGVQLYDPDAAAMADRIVASALRKKKAR